MCRNKITIKAIVALEIALTLKIRSVMKGILILMAKTFLTVVMSQDEIHYLYFFNIHGIQINT